MGIYNRYKIIKKKHQNFLIIIVRKGKYISCGIDKIIIKRFKNIEHELQKLHINYLILDNLDIIKKNEYIDNKYDKYYYLMAIRKILNKLQGKY